MFTHLEYERIRLALKFAAESHLFPEWEFFSLFGLTRQEVLSLSNFDAEKPVSEKLALAVNGAFNNLLHYPHGKLNLVATEVAPLEQLEMLGQRWRTLHLPN